MAGKSEKPSCKMTWYLGLRTVGLLLVVSSGFGDQLVATPVLTKLPLPMFMPAPYYDGESDFIYLMGGTNGFVSYSFILRFDIVSERIDEVANLPVVFFGSPLEADDTGNLIYLDSENSPYNVYKYDIVSNSVKTIGELPVRPYQSASTKNLAGNVLLIGGSLGTDIVEINVKSDSVQGNVVGQFPTSVLSSVAVKVSNNTALVFGSGGGFKYLEMDVNTLDTKDVAQSSFPEFEFGMSITSDRNYLYIFGGALVGAGVPADGIIRLDKNSHAWDILQVQNFPIIPDYRFEAAPEVIYVEKLHRIYMFGGRLLKSNPDEHLHLDDIYYIDMSPLNPTSTPPTMTTTEEQESTTLDPLLFYCEGRNDGTHPHPSDCSMYIACRNGTLEGVHPCFPPLLYDPVTRNCNIPSLVDCQLSCEDMEDGTYPHPHDCRLFIICSNRDILVSICDPPHLFDTQKIQCALPEFVQCSNL